MPTYTLLPNYNATSYDVLYAVPWTIVSSVIMFFAAMSPFIMVAKSIKALGRRMSKYTVRLFKLDFALQLFVIAIMVAYYIASIGGFLSIMSMFRPSGPSGTAIYGIAPGQETMWFVFSTVSLGYFLLSLMIYRIVRFCKRQPDAKSYNENVPIEVPSQHAKVDEEAMENTSFFKRSYGHGVDFIRDNSSLFLRVFGCILFVYGVFIFAIIYPYSINASYFTTGNFGVSSVLTMTLGILLMSSLLFTHLKGVFTVPSSQMQTYVSGVINNEEVLVHSFSNAFYGFEIGGHMITMKVDWVFILALFFFFVNIVYEVSCSFDKAFTAAASVYLIAFIHSLMAGDTATFIPYFMSALFFFSTSLFMIFYVNPPVLNGGQTATSSQTASINYNYMLTNKNCSSASMQYDEQTMFAFSILGFILGVFSVLRVCMRRPSEYKNSTVA